MSLCGAVVIVYLGFVVFARLGHGFLDPPTEGVKLRRLDGNGDGVRDLSDFAALQNCFSGSDQNPGYTAPDTDCRFGFSVDEDTDINLEEFLFFQSSMTNP